MDPEVRIVEMPKAYQGKEPYIFVSYAHADQEQVLPIVSGLQDRGFRVWYDEGLPPGENWLEHLAERVTYCGAFVPFLSANFLSSPYCKREITHAISEDKEPFAVFLQEKLDMTPGMKLLLCSVQGVYRERHNSFESFMDELCRSHYLESCRDGAYASDDDRWTAPVPKTEMEAYYLQGKQYYERLRIRRVRTTAREPDEEDAAEAVKWLTKAAELGHAEAQGMLAWVYGEMGKDGYARFWAEKAAEKGLALGQYVIGDCYMYGAGGQVKNEATGVEWYRKAALQGDCEAQYYLGRAYEDGMGVAVDRAEARKWYGRAADQGKQLAANALMRMYNEDMEAREQRNAQVWTKVVPTPEPKSEPEPKPEPKQEPEFKLDMDADALKESLGKIIKKPAVNIWEVEEKEAKAEECYQKAMPYYEKLCEDWERGHFEVDDMEKFEKTVALLREARDLSSFIIGRDRVRKEASYALGRCCSCVTGPMAEKYGGQAEAYFESAGFGIFGITDAKYHYALIRSEARDFETAEKWFLEAAKKGHLDAQYQYALCLSRKRDFEKAREWFLKAAEQGHLDAQYQYALCCSELRDFEKAEEWFLKAAEQGHAEAQWKTGEVYDFAGPTEKQDPEEAIKWYLLAAEQGVKRAKSRLEFLREQYYKEGEEQYANKNFSKAVEKYLPAAQAGHAGAQFSLGLCFSNGRGVKQDKAEAAKWYMKAAEQGDAGAQNNLAILYYDGTGVEQNHEEAFKWYQKAADQGNKHGQHGLGLCYEYGRGTEKNLAKAVIWYGRAARQNYANAQYHLGNLYYTAEKYKDAVSWLEKAAKQDIASAQLQLGMCYEHGKGVMKSKLAAKKWYKRAAEQGNGIAKMKLSRM